MKHRILAALLASSQIVACGTRQPVVPIAINDAARVTHRASVAPYLFAIPQGGDKVLWGPYPNAENSLSRAIVDGISKAVALGTAPSGELFVANKGNGTITGYASPLYTGKKAGRLLHTITPTLPTGRRVPPIALSIDGSSNLFVLLPYNVVNEYMAPDYRQMRSFTFPGTISSFIAANHHLFAAATALVWFFTYPHVSAGNINIDFQYTNNDPTALALDKKRNLYAADILTHKIRIFGPNYQSTPTKTFNFGACCRHEIGRALGDQILLVSSTYVYLVQRGEKIVQYAPPDYTTIALIDQGGAPTSAAIDSQGNLVVVNGSGGICLYQLPAGTLLKTISPKTRFEAVATVP